MIEEAKNNFTYYCFCDKGDLKCSTNIQDDYHAKEAYSIVHVTLLLVLPTDLSGKQWHSG